MDVNVVWVLAALRSILIVFNKFKKMFPWSLSDDKLNQINQIIEAWLDVEKHFTVKISSEELNKR